MGLDCLPSRDDAPHSTRKLRSRRAATVQNRKRRMARGAKITTRRTVASGPRLRINGRRVRRLQPRTCDQLSSRRSATHVNEYSRYLKSNRPCGKRFGGCLLTNVRKWTVVNVVRLRFDRLRCGAAASPCVLSRLRSRLARRRASVSRHLFGVSRV